MLKSLGQLDIAIILRAISTAGLSVSLSPLWDHGSSKK